MQNTSRSFRSVAPLACVVALSLTAGTAHAGGTPPTTLTISNDARAEQGGADFTFTLTLNVAATAAFNVVVSTTDGDATAGSDYTALTGTVVAFAIGDTSKNVQVPLNDDDTFELNETFTLGVVSTTAATPLDTSDVGVGTINDNDTEPEISIDNVTFDEGEGTVNVTVSLTNPSSSEIAVDFATSDGSAGSPSDFTATSGTLVIDPETLSGTIEVVLTPDVVDEPNQDFTITLTNPDGASIDDGTATITITDDDLPPTLSISPSSVGEGAGTVSIDVVLSAASEFAIAVNVDTAEASGEADIPTDLTDVDTSVSFAAGETEKPFSLTVVDDAIHEDDETVSVVLDVTSGGPSDITLALTITENDPRPVVNITKTQDALEGGDEGDDVDDAIFSVTLSGASEDTITVDVSTANDSAVDVQDFDGFSGTELTFDPGELTQTVNVDSNNDALDEADESFDLVPSNASGADLGTSASATITDNDAPPTISVADAAVAETEGTVTLTFTLTLSGASGRSLSVAFDTNSGTAAAGTDFVDVAETVTFDPGDVSKNVTVTVNGDVSDEDNETFAVALSAANNVTIADGAAVGTINDNDAPPVISIAGTAITEGNSATTNLPFTVSLSVPSGKTVTVTATTSDGSARQPADYASRTQAISIPPDTASVPFNVVVNGDNAFEGNDTVNATLTAPGNATIGTSTAIGTITNDDPVPTLDVTDATLGAEGNSGVRNLTFTVTLSNPSDQITTFNFRTDDGSATAGSDYSAQDTNAVITAGAISATIVVVVAGDTLDEPDETLGLLVTGASGANIGDGEGVGVIVDDDETPTLAVVTPAAAFEGNVGTANLRFDVVLSAASGQTVRVNVQTVDGTASAGSDYNGKTLTQLVFNPGVTVQPVNVTVLSDVFDEDDVETFTLPLSAPINAVLAAGGAAVGTGGVRDDDATPTLEINDITLAPEGNIGTEPATFTVNLSAPSGRTVTYSFATQDGDATAGTDYFAQSGVRQLAPGVTSETITIDVVRETAEEGDEIFNVVLSDVQNAVLLDGSGFCVILNDDDGPVTGVDGPFTVVEEQSLTVAQPGVLANDADADGDALFAELRDAPNTALEGALQLLPDGGFNFTPVADFAGVVTFSYVATDGVNDSAPRVVTINVSNVNDAPILDAAAVQAHDVVQDEDDPDPPSVLVDELAFDAVLDVDTVDLPGIAIVDVPPAADGVVEISLDDGTTWLPVPNASEGAAVLVPPEGLIRLRPPLDATPTGVVTFRAWDGSDNAATGPDAPADVTLGDDAPFSATTASLEFVVLPVNDAPVFVAPTPGAGDTVIALEGVLTTIEVAASDVDDDTGDLEFSVDPLASTLPASAVFDPNNGRLALTPEFFEAGAYVVRFVVTDAAGAFTTRDVTVQIAFNDGDLDGLPDSWETDVGFDPDSDDTDGDTIGDFDEAGDIGLAGDLTALLDPTDTDDDGSPDGDDTDADGDGVLDRDEAGDARVDTPPVTSDGDDTADFRDVNADDDDFEDFADNCRTVPNNDQDDLEGDGIGDGCDPDGDGDRLADDLEPELGLSDEDADADDDTILDGDEVGDPSEPADSDDDGVLDALEEDSDADGVADAEEAGDDEPGTQPVDTDEDGVADYQDVDSDDDDVLDDTDNCRITKNSDQVDLDEDGVGDACLQVCGDGNVQSPEECDDGNTAAGDLCDGECQNECDQPEVCDNLDQDCDGLVDLVASPGGGLVSVCEDRDITVRGGGLLSACGCSSGPDASLPVFAVALLAVLMRRRRRASAGVAGALLLCVALSGGARAAEGDGMQIQQFTPAAGGAEDLVLLEGTSVNGHLRPAAGIYLDYSYATLNLRDDLTDASVALLEHHVGATVVGSLSILDRAQVALQVPLTAFQSAGVDDIFIPATLSPRRSR